MRKLIMLLFAGVASASAMAAVPQLDPVGPSLEARVEPATHYWWLKKASGNVPTADPHVCSGEGESAAPETLCGAQGTYLGKCGTGAGFTVRGLLLARGTPAEMQIVLVPSKGQQVLYCHPVVNRSQAQKLGAKFQGQRIIRGAPGLAEALASCKHLNRSSCRLAWYGFEPAGGPDRVLADTKKEGIFRISQH